MRARLSNLAVPSSTVGGVRGRETQSSAPSFARAPTFARALMFGRQLRALGTVPAKKLFTLPKDLADRTGPMAKSRSLSWRLGVSTLVIVLPLVIFALLMVGWIAYDEREKERNELIGD